MLNTKKSEIAVIFGGKSSEHLVSLYSANNVLEHIDREKYRIRAIFIGQDGQWYVERPFYAYLKNIPLNNYLIKSLLKDLSGLRYKKTNIIEALAGVDAVFNALHGENGEDGKIQGLLDYLKIPYTGSGVLTCALSMDKLLSRSIFRDAGFFVPLTVVVSREEFQSNMGGAFNRIAGTIPRGPWVVKPRARGQSVGVSMADTPEEAMLCLKQVFTIDSHALVEEYLEGVEVTCGILGKSGKPIALTPLEIVLKNGRRIFAEEVKYNKELFETIAPPRLPEGVVENIKAAALRTHELLGCEMYSRTDMIVKGGHPFILEVNALPGLSLNSLYNRGLKATGFSPQEFINGLLAEVLKNNMSGSVRPRQ